MTRLIRALRDDICENVRNSLFVNELAEIEKRKEEFGDKFFDKHVATPEQYEIMKQLPASFFVNQAFINCIIHASPDGGCYTRSQLRMSRDRRIPAFASRYSSVTAVDSELYEALQKLEQEEHELRQQLINALNEVRKILLSISTVNKLVEIWPEGKQFIPAEAFSTGTRGVPALLVANLNAVLMQAGVQFSSDNVAA